MIQSPMTVHWLVLVVGLIVLLGCVGLCIAIFWILFRIGPGLTRRGQPARAEETLAQRFAAGEIDQEEYQFRLRVLRGHGDDGKS